MGCLLTYWTSEAGFGNHSGTSEELVFDDKAEDHLEGAMAWLLHYAAEDWTPLSLTVSISVTSAKKPKHRRAKAVEAPIANKLESWICLLCKKPELFARCYCLSRHKTIHIDKGAFDQSFLCPHCPAPVEISSAIECSKLFAEKRVPQTKKTPTRSTKRKREDEIPGMVVLDLSEKPQKRAHKNDEEQNPLSSSHPAAMHLSKFGISCAMSLLQIFLVIIAIELSRAVILFHSWTIFSTPSSIIYIFNLPGLSSSCLAITSFLLHLVLAVRTPPPKLTNQDLRFLPYKQYFMFSLIVLTTIPNALSCAALFYHRDLDHNHLANIFKLVCLLHGFLIEALLVWASYRLMTVIHNLLLTKDHDQDNVEKTPRSNTVSSREVDIVGEPTDEKQDNEMPCNLDGKAFNSDGEIIEMLEFRGN
ncbi:hypothetical protein EW146_g3485 [Bondarzewia mesenterica]|uniref:Uncharacterized protein n=1 Tax=Bondarzewia mesenterica TaxID=1095465 RepID=A0A4S4LXW0_9AGAM|nr:hypothetical protein EW146_g3485 [Bondarzewia mesenterica]